MAAGGGTGLGRGQKWCVRVGVGESAARDHERQRLRVFLRVGCCVSIKTDRNILRSPKHNRAPMVLARAVAMAGGIWALRCW